MGGGLLVAHKIGAVVEGSHAASGYSLAAVSLRDDAVCLGPVLPNDLGAIFTWMNDTAAARLDFAWRPLDYNAFKSWIEKLSSDTTQVLFAVRRIANPEIVGFVLLKNIQLVHRSAELGIRIGTETDRGQGIGTRAVRLALEYAWNTLNLHRVSLATLAHNTRAVASYRSAGFKEEGRLREASYIDGQWCDITIMAALRHDCVSRTSH
jgi:RimJ/RimL family protein N-acetyltransferase